MTTQNNYASVANSFYLAFYGRPADPAGLAFWSQQLASVDGELADITLAFSTSQEAQTRFGSDTLNERITDIYQQLFNRAPDAAGLAYWSGAVSSGNATLADVAISILGGAQGGDQSLSALRLKAADAFTAAVDASDSGYSGYASIEAARVLLRSVTANASETDLTALVRAAVSFADTATKTPSVVDAIASGSTLLALFDTARGLGDPVALAQALADTAKAAAGDAATLTQLLRGGGMAQVLKVMPANATLKDVVAALAAGGLPAAIDVVYPPTPVPSRAIDISFAGVTQGDDDSVDDHVTNVTTPDITFKYTGRDLVDGQHFEFTLNGVNWNVVDSSNVNTTNNTITIPHLYIGGLLGRLDNSIQTYVPQPDVTTSITMRAVQGGRVLDSTQAQIVYDSSAPIVGVNFVRLVGGADGVPTTDEELVSAAFAIDGPLGDGIVQYRLVGSDAWTVLDPDDIDSDGVFTIAGIDLSLADRTVEVRVIDAAGNAREPFTQLIDGPYHPPQVISEVVGAGFAMTGNPSLVVLYSGPDEIIHAEGTGAGPGGLLSAGSLQLFDMLGGTEQPTVTDYLDGQNFNVFTGGSVRFDDTLPIGLYKLAWENNTFATANGSIAEGELLFAGGVSPQLLQQGFVLDHVAVLDANVELGSDDLVGIAYLNDDLMPRTLMTGDARDVVIDNGGALDIGFRDFKASAQDLVFGFDSGSDVISLHGTAASSIDKNNDGVISWVTSVNSGAAAVTATTEAVSIVYGGLISTSTSSYESDLTLAALNGSIDLTAMVEGADLLILAITGTGNGGALFHFKDMDGNAQIDEDELTLFAVFDDGAPVTTDVIVVGSQDNSQIPP